jgi:hypothetical protein
MIRRAGAALPLLAAAFAAGLRSVPRAAAALGGACAAAALLAVFAPEAPPAWLAAAAAFGAAEAARLLGHWCADSALGFRIAAAAAAAGAAVESALPPPSGEPEALAWAAAGGMLAAALPTLVRFLGQNSVEPLRLFSAARGDELFLLVQPALLIAAAAAALARAARGLARRPGRAFLLLAAPAGAAAAVALPLRFPPDVALGAAGAALALGALASGRPWRWGRTSLSGRALAAAALAAFAFAAGSRDALIEAWTARLDALYPGGRYLTVIDDGASAWTAYVFPRGDRALLRDGLLQTDVPEGATVALATLLGQVPRVNCSVVLARPGPSAVSSFSRICRTSIVDGSPAEAAALDAALGGGRAAYGIEPSTAAPSAAALFFLPAGLSPRAAVARLSETVAASRPRMAADAATLLLAPPDTSDAELDALRDAARAAFGNAASARFPSGHALVYAAAQIPNMDADVLLMNLAGPKTEDAQLARPLLKALRWRETPSAK